VAAEASYRILALDQTCDRSGFACGVEVLDRYLRAQAGQDIRKRIAACFVAYPKGAQAVAGYYTLAASSVALTDLPPDLVRRLPRYPAVPATLLGRLAVDCRHRGQGLGELMLFDAFSRTLRSEIATFALLVDAKNDRARTFYERYCFMPLTNGGRRLFLPLAEIAKLLG
jgi:ribosomal protein S18 acetylase RimI-like enzyme